MEWINRTEVRKKINIGRTTLWELERSGGFPKPHMLGHKALFVKSEIEVWMERKRQEGLGLHGAPMVTVAG